MISPAEYDMTIYEGATFSRTFIFKDDSDVPVDLTGYTGRMHIRNTVDSASFLDCTSSLTLGTTGGDITLLLDDEFATDVGYTTGVYDLEIENTSGVVIRLLMGKITISEEVTR